MRTLVVFAVLFALVLSIRDARAAPWRGDDVARSAPGGHAWLSIVGFSLATPAGTRETGGFVLVGLPFDRMARSSVRAALADPPPRPSPSPTPPAPSDDLAIAISPKVARAAVGAAWRVSGLGADDARLDAIVSRAHLAALLPEMRLRVIRWDDERVYSDYPGETTLPTNYGSANLGLEARLTWRLDRLLFSEDEPSFERIRLERQDARGRVASRVLEVLFHWQRAWLEMKWARSREPRDTHEEAEAALRALEAEATLDVLTAGWFTTWRAGHVAGAPAVPLPSPGER